MACYGERIRARADEIARVQLELIELGEMRVASVDVEFYVSEPLAEVRPEVSRAEHDRIAAKARERLETRRAYLEALIAGYDT